MPSHKGRMIYALLLILDKCLLLSRKSLPTRSDTLSDGARVGSGYMVLFFMYDEFTDKVGGNGTKVYAKTIIGALRDLHKERPQGQLKLGQITRQYAPPTRPFAYFVDPDLTRL